MKHKISKSDASSGIDARIVRTNQALCNALLVLVESKPLEQITVRDIAAKAGVHYATFFRHHPTKESLLDHIARHEIDCLVELALSVQEEVDTNAGFVALCQYIADHRSPWTALLNGGAARAMREELLQVSRDLAAARAPTDSWLPVDLATTCTVSLIIETISWWLTQPSNAYSIEEVAQILNRLVSSLDLQIDA